MILKSSILMLILLFASTNAYGEYTLSFDWFMISPSEETDIGYVTWNQETLLTLQNIPESKEINK